MAVIVLQGLGSRLLITQGFGPSQRVPGCVKGGDLALFIVKVGDLSCGGCCRTMFNIHDFGAAVRLHTLDSEDGSSRPFTDAVNGGAIDPDGVSVTIKQPDGTIETFTYSEEGTDVVKEDVGQYYIDIDANQVGTWYYRWWSTGNGQASEERRFVVRAAQAVDA